MLSAKRDGKAAARFFRRVLKASHVTPPRVINVDKNAAYRVAIEKLKSEQTLAAQTELRQVKYLNNLIEQDHRNIKRIVKPMLGLKSFHSARRTLSRIEAINLIRKGQVEGVEKGDVRAQVDFVSQIFGLVAYLDLDRGSRLFFTSFCDRAAYPVAMETLENDETLATETELRQVKYLNNGVEQGHRNIKRITKPMMGFKAFNSARKTVRGIEAMNMIRKAQVKGVEKGDSVSQMKFIEVISEIAA